MVCKNLKEARSIAESSSYINDFFFEKFAHFLQDWAFLRKIGRNDFDCFDVRFSRCTRTGSEIVWLFCAIFEIWIQNVPLKSAISTFFVNPMFTNCVHATSIRLFTQPNVNISFEQIVAILPWNATGLVGNLKTFNFWVFLETVGFFKENWTFFWISRKAANLLWNAFQMVIFRQDFSSASLLRFFRQKNQKTLIVRKVRKNGWESLFSRKKRFHVLKSLPYKNGKAQNMAVVAGRLVQSLSDKNGTSCLRNRKHLYQKSFW